MGNRGWGFWGGWPTGKTGRRAVTRGCLLDTCGTLRSAAWASLRFASRNPSPNPQGPTPNPRPPTPTTQAPIPTPQSPRRWVLAALVAILLLAAGLRGLYLAELVRNPLFGDPAVDAQYHDYWARGLATGNWTPPEGCPDPLIRTRPFLRPPGYPYFLAIIYRVIGPSYVGAAVVQMAALVRMNECCRLPCGDKRFCLPAFSSFHASLSVHSRKNLSPLPPPRVNSPRRFRSRARS